MYFKLEFDTGSTTLRLPILKIFIFGVDTLKPTTKGFLPPRMSTTEMNAITSPPVGLMASIPL